MIRRHHLRAAPLALLSALSLGGCIGETMTRGYVAAPQALEQVSVGSSREQVLLVLGTPSTTAEFSGEVFYYISQKAKRPVAFMGAHVVDQHVMAVYFDQNHQVTQVADYGLKDGRVFDFVSRTTPTAGKDFSFISQILSAATIPKL